MERTDKLQAIVQILRSSVQAVRRKTRIGAHKIGSALAGAWSRAWARPRLLGGIAGGVVVVGCAAALTLHGLPDSKVFAPLLDAADGKRTLPELVKLAQADPNDASIQAELGNAYFEAGQRAAALHAYDKALQLDETAATDRMIENLVSCYGRREMGAAGAIITRYRLVGSEDELRALVSNKRWPVRNGALNTLDGLNKAWRDDFLTVYTLDLASSNCDIRRAAVEKLGRLGDARALDEIRAAKQRDEAATPWYAFSCLGDRPEDAEQRILAKR